MIFASDNWSGASDRIVAALADIAKVGGAAYGGDRLSKAVEKEFSRIFARDVAVFFVGTGTAANSLSLSAFARPGGIVFAHHEAHITVDEANATEFFGGGVRVVGLGGAAGKLTPEVLAAAIAKYPAGNVHHGRPVAVSLTQVTELGTAYRPEEVSAIAGTAKASGLAVHMDGARFAGAVASLNRSPADITWRSGVDVLSFGGTKNGCVAAEAVVFFNPEQAAYAGLARQRAGHGFSKAWFIAAQFEAYFEDAHWLDMARHANAMAARLVLALRAAPGVRLAVTPDANEVFAVLPRGLDARLKAAGAIYHEWSPEALPADERPRADEVLVRLVTSFKTTADDIDALSALVLRG
jgi:threonine aldolase